MKQTRHDFATHDFKAWLAQLIQRVEQMHLPTSYAMERIATWREYFEKGYSPRARSFLMVFGLKHGGRSRSAGAGSEGLGHSWPAPSVVTIVDAVSRQRLTAAPSLSACTLISLSR